MIDRRLLVKALRIENKEITPKFDTQEFRSLSEQSMEAINIDSLIDYEEGVVTEDGIYSIMDALDGRGSVGIEDSEGTPAISFILRNNEIIAHNLFTDEDTVLDVEPSAIAEYIIDQLEQDAQTENESAATTPVAFKFEYTSYLDKYDVIAVFIDEIETVDGDVARQLVYRLSDHGESYEDPSAMEKLPDATVHQYEPLKKELEEKGYNIEIWNEPQEPAMHEDFNGNMRIKYFDWTKALDDYEEGEGDSISVDFGKPDKEIQAESPEEALKAVAEFAENQTGIPGLAEYLIKTEGIIYEEEDSRFSCSFSADEDDLIPTDEEHEKWRDGNLNLYAHIFMVYVESESNESAIHEDAAEANNVIEDVLEMCKDLVPALREKAMAVLAGKISGKDALREFLIELKTAVIGKVTETLQDRIENAISNLHKEMNEELDLTNVVFKKDEDDLVFAVFVDEKGVTQDPDSVLIYSHVGQHGVATRSYVEEMEDATPEEYEELAEELRGQGYNLNILNGLAEESPLEVPVGFAMDETQQNYAIVIAQDVGNEYNIIEIKEGYSSFDEAQAAIDDMGDSEFYDDPTMMLFVAYSDGMSWFNAVTGDELIIESVNEDYELITYHDNGIGDRFELADGKILRIVDMGPDYIGFELDGKRQPDISPEEFDKLELKGICLESANEDSEASKIAEDLLNYVEEAMSNAKDNIIKRLKYRLEDNVSYFGSEAEEKAEEVKTQVKNALINLADSIYEVIG